MEALLQDVKFGLRMMTKAPGFTAVAVLTLALGIGATTAIFSVIDAVLLHPIDVTDIGRLVAVSTVDTKTYVGPGSPRLPISYPNFKDLRDSSNVFSGMSAFVPFGVTLTGQGAPEQLTAMLVSANYFDVLGVKAQVGRTFFSDEDSKPGGNPLAVLSYQLWQQRFGGNANIVGRPITLNGESYTVIGVAAKSFNTTFAFAPPNIVYVPISMYGQVLTGQSLGFFNQRRFLGTLALGRLKPGLSREQAEGSPKVIASHLAEQYPVDNQGRSIALSPLLDAAVGVNQYSQFVRAGGVLLGVVALVLLIACTNLAGLLLARSLRREREFVVRAALGARPKRLAAQLLTESVLLALRVARADWGEALKSGSRGSSALTGHTKVRSVLVMAEVALAVVVLAFAGLFARSFEQAQQLHLGFDAHNLAVMNFNLGSRHYTPEQDQQFYQQVLERVGAVPGVSAVTVSSNGVFGGGFGRTVFHEGEQQTPGKRGSLTTTDIVSNDYFQTMRIPLLQGRLFTSTDREGTAPVAIINQAMARHFWPDQNPVGLRFTFFGDPKLIEIIGVVGTTVVVQVGEPPVPLVYLPLLQNDAPLGSVIVRSSVPPAMVISAVRNEIQSLDRDLAITNAQTADELIRLSLWAPRMGAGLFSLFALLAVILAAVGLYGVLAYSVSQRTGEIGLRMALGASPGDVFRLILTEGGRLALAGLGVGVAGALALGHLVESLLFGVSGADPTTFAIVVGLLVAVSFSACYLPARRATRVAPVTALRYE